jgi:hypothetical protein
VSCGVVKSARMGKFQRDGYVIWEGDQPRFLQWLGRASWVAR